MKKYIETLGNVIQNQTQISPDNGRKLLEWVYNFVKLTGTHKLAQNSNNAFDYMTGTVAGTIADSFKQPQQSVMMNIFFPCEIFHAMDLHPMFPEGISAYLACTGCQKIFAETAEANDIPETYCSYHKTMMGLAETGVMPKPLMIANTTLACDANQLSFRRLADFYQIPHFVLDVPHSSGEDSVKYVADQLRDLTDILEDITGKTLDQNRLKQIMLKAQKSVQLNNKILEKRKYTSIPSNMSGEMDLMISTHMMLGTDESLKFQNKLLKALDNSPNFMDSPKKRILWVHTLPNWQESMTDIFEKENRVEIVGTDLSLDNTLPVDIDKPYETMARRLVESPYNGSSSKRIKKVLEYAKEANVDGILIFCHWGCKQTLGMSQLAKHIFESEGFPTLVLDGDGCDARNVADGQMVTRVNAFIEQLEGFSA